MIKEFEVVRSQKLSFPMTEEMPTENISPGRVDPLPLKFNIKKAVVNVAPGARLARQLTSEIGETLLANSDADRGC